jgi:short-chain Z-isoprenyl diphosphate synthase
LVTSLVHTLDSLIRPGEIVVAVTAFGLLCALGVFWLVVRPGSTPGAKRGALPALPASAVGRLSRTLATAAAGAPVAGIAPPADGTGRRAVAPRLRGGLRHWTAAVAFAPVYRLYSARLRRQVASAPLPDHVAVILDGNRRWATASGMDASSGGHRSGADKLDELLDWCSRLGIDQVTVWALSNENLARPQAEVAALVDIVAEKLEQLASRHAEQSIRIRVVGRLDQLPERLRRSIDDVERSTAGNDGVRLNVAVGYSGRDELVDAARSLVRRLADQGVPAGALADGITRDALAAHLYTAGDPDPDLIIRTSGEVRLSGFLPWQSSHSELYFTDVYWPALRELDFLRALRSYQQRERRYGR